MQEIATEIASAAGSSDCSLVRDLNSLIAINRASCNLGPGSRVDNRPARAAIELLIFLQNALILFVRKTGTLCEWCITGPRISGI